MKENFNNQPPQYFLNRPIEPNFLKYSARDVEDLVEVFNNAKNKISKYLEDFSH